MLAMQLSLSTRSTDMVRRLAVLFLIGILSTYIGAYSAMSAPNASALLGYPVNLTPGTGYVNSKVVVSVNQFPGNATVQVTFDGVYKCTLTTASDGTGSCYFKVPATDMGLHKVVATGGGFSSFRFFNVDPRVKLTPNYGPRGTTMDVSLRGFTPGTFVTVKWYNSTQSITIKTLTTSSTGSANFYFTVPSNAMVGAYKVHAKQYNWATAATFTVT
jgi:hypothetical protein